MPAVTVEIMTTANKIDNPYNEPYLNPCIKTPNTKETIAAKQSILMVSSSKVARTISFNVLCSLTMGAFVPNFFALFSKSYASPDKPVCIMGKSLEGWC